MVLVLGVDPQWRSHPVWESIVQIAGCDPGIESVVHAYFSGWGARVYYNQKVNSVSANRLKAIVEHPKYVVVYGAGSDGVNPTDGKPLITTGGGSITYHKADGSASIYVDVDDARGQHYLAPGHGGTVHDSLPTIVYHELAHAYYHLIGQNPPAYRDKEILARRDENEFRSHVGLKLLNVYDDSDPGFGIPTLGTLGFPACKPTGFTWCNIATVALGSPVARQIVAFRRAKREFERLTLGSTPLLEPMLSSYRLFSPLVASDMQSDPALRDAMLHYGVQPAVHLVQLVRALIAGRPDDMALVAAADREISQYLGELPDGPSTQLASAADAAAAASDVLSTGDESRLSGMWHLPGDAFASVTSSVQATRAESAGPAWVLAGIALFLRQATDRLGGVATAPDPRFESAIGDWLASVPLPDDAVLTDPVELGAELTVLNKTLFHHDANRVLFMHRIRERWPQASAALDALQVDYGEPTRRR